MLNYFHLVTTSTSKHIPHRLHIHTHSRTHAYNLTQTCHLVTITTLIPYSLYIHTHTHTLSNMLMLSPALVLIYIQVPFSRISLPGFVVVMIDTHVFNGCILCNISSHPTKQWTNSP